MIEAEAADNEDCSRAVVEEHAVDADDEGRESCMDALFRAEAMALKEEVAKMGTDERSG
jgi:hypothetical protein